MSDSELIAHECQAAWAEGREISDACARMIASQWHGGQASLGYSFASTGAIPAETSGLWRELFTDYGRLRTADKLAADALGTYLISVVRGNGWKARGPVAGWSGLWLS
jgi:hypothetical protein